MLVLLVVKQIKLIWMPFVQLLILLRMTLRFYIAADDLFTAVATDRRHEVAFRPKLTVPKLFAHLRVPRSNLTRCDTLDRPHDLRWTIARHRLHEKVYMVVVSADFEKLDLIAFLDFKAHIAQRLIDHRVKDDQSVLGWTDEVIEQDRDVMAFVDVAAHAAG